MCASQVEHRLTETSENLKQKCTLCISKIYGKIMHICRSCIINVDTKFHGKIDHMPSAFLCSSHMIKFIIFFVRKNLYPSNNTPKFLFTKPTPTVMLNLSPPRFVTKVIQLHTSECHGSLLKPSLTH